MSIIVLLIFSYPFVFKKPVTQIKIKNQIIKIELARTSDELTKGLSNRDFLDPNSGMLFIFPRTDIYKFWMKDTRIPLDIIWINHNQIVEMTSLNPPIDNNIPEYSPKNPANYVLEVNAGFIKNHDIKIGDKITLK